MRALFVAVGWWAVASVVCLLAVGVFLYQLRNREQPRRRPSVVVVPDQPAPADDAVDLVKDEPATVDLGGPASGPQLRGQLLQLTGTYRLECRQCDLALEIRLPAAAVGDVVRQTEEFVERHTHGDVAPHVTIRLD